MEWARLLSPARSGHGRGERPGRAGGTDARGPFVRDLDRIIYSSAFRRLQGKTQVHAFPESDHVRTRLTHSLEVSAVGRSLALSVGAHLAARRDGGLPPGLTASDLGDLVAAACLAHDIGHPPFGHAGEEAIRNWFRFDRPELVEDPAAGLGDAERADLQGFEANAQGFRLLARLQFWRQQGGMRLTLATLGALSKYPWGSVGDRAGTGEGRAARAKFGYFHQDRELFAGVAEHLGLLPSVHGEGFCRHPLAFLVEAADDICYLIVDIEDGVKSGRLAFAEAEGLLRPIAEKEGGLDEDPVPPDDRLAYLRAKSIGQLVGEAARAFLHHEDEMLAGRLETPLLADVESGELVARMRAICHERLYHDESKQRIEVAAFAVVRGLLGAYCETLLSWERSGRDTSRMPYLHQRTLRLLPPEVVAATSRYDGLLAVTDYVSGMTNRFALGQHRLLLGVGRGGDLPERELELELGDD